MNKWFYPILAGVFLLTTSCGSNMHLYDFYHQNKARAGTTNFVLPGWVIWFGSGLLHESTKDAQLKESLHLLKRVGKIRFMVSENATSITTESIDQLRHNIRADYEDLILIKDSKTNVSIMVKEKNEKIRGLLILVRDEEDFVFLDIKTRLRPRDLIRFIKSFKKEMKVEQPLRRPRPQA